MGLFNWSAPLFGHLGDRWDAGTISAWAAWLAPHMGTRRALLDLGGGTGALAARLADALDARATVLDPTPEMIAQMKPHPRVTAHIGVAEAMPFSDGEFDAVVVSDAFHHFRDQDGAVREMARVVRPGGGALVLEFDGRGWMRLVVWGERLLGEPGAFLTPEEMCHFMSERGIDGRCEKTSAANYYFMGSVAAVPSRSGPGLAPTA